MLLTAKTVCLIKPLDSLLRTTDGLLGTSSCLCDHGVTHYYVQSHTCHPDMGTFRHIRPMMSKTKDLRGKFIKKQYVLDMNLLKLTKTTGKDNCRLCYDIIHNIKLQHHLFPYLPAPPPKKKKIMPFSSAQAVGYEAIYK